MLAKDVQKINDEINDVSMENNEDDEKTREKGDQENEKVCEQTFSKENL